MKKILLTREQFALVDDEDFKELSKYKWHAHKNKYGDYVAERSYYFLAGNKRQRSISMHRQIMNCPDGMIIDHINHNTLDNRKGNLRICTVTENGQNRKIQRNTSGYKGVLYRKDRNRWYATLRVNRKAIYLGYFNSKIMAAKAYNQAAVKHFGEFANINKGI